VGKNLNVSVDVRNEGSLEGDEVVELYLRHPDTHGRTPIHALAGFERVHLKAGEKKTVAFSLDPRQLSVVRENGDRVEEPGKLEIFTGGGQPLEKALSGGQVLRATILLTGKNGVLISK
jgi:beta-glucosidase